MSSFELSRGVQAQSMNNKTNNALEIGLYITATPIGNLDDLTKRSIYVLQNVDFIICENPKHSLKLLNKLGIKKRLFALHDHNEEKIINQLSKKIHNSAIALISDAGSPLISDPGYKLIKYFVQHNLKITTVPGPSSIISSLQLSNLPINNFVFYGFVPKKKTQRKIFFEKIKKINLTSVFFTSAKNLIEAVSDILNYIGDEKISICKEITKLNEQVFREKASIILNLLKENKINLKGEFTIVIDSKIKEKKGKMDPVIENELINLLKKYNLTEAVKIVHNLSGISKKDVYQLAIKLKND